MLHLDTCMHIESTTKIAIGVGLYPDEWDLNTIIYDVSTKTLDNTFRPLHATKDSD